MDETKREKVIDIAILVVMGLVLLMPIGFAIAASGMFGKIMLLGKSEFSPWMDRLLLLGTAFWLMYLWSWFVPEVKNRAPKVFGCVALFAICSIVAIQFDNMLIPNFADTAAKDAANVWFFNLPYYALRAFDTGMGLLKDVVRCHGHNAVGFRRVALVDQDRDCHRLEKSAPDLGNVRSDAFHFPLDHL